MRPWLTTPLSTVTRLYRRATSQSRAWPDFIVVGAQKSGTTSLSHYLSQHPQLVPATAKEVHFFDGGLDPDTDNFEKGPGWYGTHFPVRKDLRADQKTFEASPLYLFNPLAPRRIFELLPRVKLVAILRNPTERAISHYFHERRLNQEALPLYEALQAEEERLRPALEEHDYKSTAYIHHSYKSRGRYKEQLERYLQYFPWTQLFVVSSEELFTDPHHTLSRLFEFLDVQAEFRIEDLTACNVSTGHHSVDPRTREYLEEYFRPHNESLYELVKRAYDWQPSG